MKRECNIKVAKQIILAVITLFAVSYGRAENKNETLWAAATQEYAAGNYQAAWDNFSQIEQEGYAAKELYYNMGNCAYRLNKIGKAVLYYERALKLNPSDSDVKANLEMARAQSLDKIDSLPEFVFVTWLRGFRNTLSANAWAIISLLFAALFLLLLYMLRFGGMGVGRKIKIILSMVALVAALLSFVFSLSLALHSRRAKEAVVTDSSATVKSAPNSNGNTIFILHEGTKVEILESVAPWYKIEIADGRQGWLKESDVEAI